MQPEECANSFFHTIRDTTRGETALVFIHCWLCNQSFWENQVSEFKDRYTTVTIDLAGHGASGCERQSWSIPSFADDVQAVISKLNLSKTVLVAHSMGGPVALEIATRSSDRIEAIVFVDTIHDMDLKPTPEDFRAMMEPFKKDYRAAIRQAFESRLASPHDPRTLDWILDQAFTVDQTVGMRAMEGMAQYDVRAAAKAVAIPLRAINGSVRPSNREANQRHLKDYDLVVMDDVGHFPHLEKPDEFNTRLNETLQALGL